MGFFIGVASALITIVTKICRIFEIIIKGLINILGSIFSKKCSFLRGIKYLTWNLGKSLIELPFSVLNAVFGIFEKTREIAANPNRYATTKILSHQVQLETLKALNAAGGWTGFFTNIMNNPEAVNTKMDGFISSIVSFAEQHKNKSNEELIQAINDFLKKMGINLDLKV